MANHQTFLVCFLLIIFPFVWSAPNRLSANEVLAISSNRTILSPGNFFELGFFKLGAGDTEEDGHGWYLGIWLHNSTKREIVWVANRERPLYGSNGALKISDSNLVLTDHSGTVVWSANPLVPSPPPSPVVAELLAGGNFVLRYSQNRDSRLWESFDFPTDTLLPGMKLGLDSTKGVNRSLTSWKNEFDRSIGTYRLIQGIQEMFFWNETSPIYRVSLGDISLTPYAFSGYKGQLLLKVTFSGTLQQLSSTQDWTLLPHHPADPCDYYGDICGFNSVCSFVYDEEYVLVPSCTCFKGFKPRYTEAWWSGDRKGGCTRISRLSCDGNALQVLASVKLPDATDATVERNIIGFKKCRRRCLKDCNCTGFANVDLGVPGSDCLIYRSDLVDIRARESGQQFYVKVAATDLVSGKGTRISGKIKILIIIGGAIVILLTFAIFWWCWRRITKATRAIARNTDLLLDEGRTDLFGEHEGAASGVTRMEYRTLLEATNDFSDSNQLGQGGFGTVYKGRLSDGNEIAVKRLTKMTDAGTSQFLNEVKLISRLQHVHLIRLLGFCVHGKEHLLVFEYLENRSLDFYVFGGTESWRLTWQKRFDIIHGIARGLMYLHQDSLFRIIHRDLKASNILLDKDMIPKIADFAQRSALEPRYMSPEYLEDGIFSDKSHVFSFGVVLLELLSGKRNYKFMNANGDTSLLSCVWRNWEEENLLEIVDPVLMHSISSPSTVPQIVRSFQLGLLCVQKDAEDRPNMSSVVVMLESAAELPRPKPPGYCDQYYATTCSAFEIGSTSTGPPASDYISVIEPR